VVEGGLRSVTLCDITFSKIVNAVDTMSVFDINCPNENDGTTMPVVNYIKEWIRSPGTQDV
jgi:hypothetical protein